MGGRCGLATGIGGKFLLRQLGQLLHSISKKFFFFGANPFGIHFLKTLRAVDDAEGEKRMFALTNKCHPVFLST